MHRRYRLWLLSNRVKGVLHCYRVTGNSRRRLALESFPAKHHTPTLHDPRFCRDSRTAAGRFQDEIVRSGWIRRSWGMQNPLENMFLSPHKAESLQDAPQ
jgi:hypothetical protein